MDGRALAEIEEEQEEAHTEVRPRVFGMATSEILAMSSEQEESMPRETRGTQVPPSSPLTACPEIMFGTVAIVRACLFSFVSRYGFA